MASSVPSGSSHARRLLQKLLSASRGCPPLAARALGVALLCASSTLAQGPRSAFGVAPCPPPPGENRCHPGGDARLLWIYNSGRILGNTNWITDRGDDLPLGAETRVISTGNPQIVQTKIFVPLDAPGCPNIWSTSQPLCHPRCALTDNGVLQCDRHLVQFIPPNQEAYRQLSPCPPPPGQSRCAIQGLPGWTEVHDEPTPPRFSVSRGLPSFRFGAGPVSYRAPGSSSREVTGSFEVAAGYIAHAMDRTNSKYLLRFLSELGYAHDWGSGYRGHAFLAGVGAGVSFGGKKAHSFSYVPHLSLGSRGGFTPGIRHGLRYTYFFALNVELQHQYLHTPDGGSNHLGIIFGLDPVSFGTALFSSIGGRPLRVEGDHRSASLATSGAWA